MVIIAGLEAPKVGILNKGVREPSEPFALEGQAFTRDKIMQTEVSKKSLFFTFFWDRAQVEQTLSW